MNTMWLGFWIMLGAVALPGAIVGFFTSKYNNFGEGLICGTNATWNGNASKVVAMYAIATFTYFVGLLTYQPTIMTSPKYSPLAYAVLVTFCGIVGFLIMSGLFWAIFAVLKKLAEWYTTISNK